MVITLLHGIYHIFAAILFLWSWHFFGLPINTIPLLACKPVRLSYHILYTRKKDAIRGDIILLYIKMLIYVNICEQMFASASRVQPIPIWVCAHFRAFIGIGQLAPRKKQPQDPCYAVWPMRGGFIVRCQLQILCSVQCQLENESVKCPVEFGVKWWANDPECRCRLQLILS